MELKASEEKRLNLEAEEQKIEDSEPETFNHLPVAEIQRGTNSPRGIYCVLIH